MTNLSYCIITQSAWLCILLSFSRSKRCWPGVLAVSDWPNTNNILGFSCFGCKRGCRLWFIHQQTHSVCSLEKERIYHVDSSRASSSTSLKVNTDATKMLASFFLSFSAPFWLVLWKHNISAVGLIWPVTIYQLNKRLSTAPCSLKLSLLFRRPFCTLP